MSCPSVNPRGDGPAKRWSTGSRREVDGEDVEMFSLVCPSSILARSSQ